MKTKYFIHLVIVNFLIIGFARTAQAAAVQYPVQELGNCQTETECKTYCDKPENIGACLIFAEKNNLMSEEELKMAKKFVAAAGQTPGVCKTEVACKEYCDDISHIDECLSFAEKNDLIPAEELAEAKKVQAAIKKGVKPPACGNKKACDVYCDSPEHMEECIAFGEAAGFIQGKELEDAQKMLTALKKGVKPPPCRGKEACDEYCSQPDNMETCMTFAMEAGFMSEQEKADSQKMLAALKKGVKPPNCRGKEECDVYCQEDEHFEECLNFAEAAGFMSPEDAAMARKTGGKGPGGCKGKEECEAFCNNPDNQETCFNFGKEHGLIPEEDLRRIEEGQQQFKQALEQAPEQVLDCFTSQFGSETMEKFKSGAAMPSEETGEKMRGCFEQMMPSQGPGGPGGPGSGGGMAPGPAPAGPIECQNPEECGGFQPMIPGNEPGGGSGGGMGIPGDGNLLNEQPAEFQQMQEQMQQQIEQQMQQQMQNQMMPPIPQTPPINQGQPSGLIAPKYLLASMLSVFSPVLQPFLLGQ